MQFLDSYHCVSVPSYKPLQ